MTEKLLKNTPEKCTLAEKHFFNVFQAFFKCFSSVLQWASVCFSVPHTLNVCGTIKHPKHYTQKLSHGIIQFRDYAEVMSRRQHQNRSGVSPISYLRNGLQRNGKPMTQKEAIFNFIQANPGCNQTQLITGIASEKYSINKIRKVCLEMVHSGILLQERGAHNQFKYFCNQGEYKCEVPDIPQKHHSSKVKMFLYGIQIIGEAPVKIGITKDLKDRILFMQTSNYKQMCVSFAALTQNAEAVEARLHGYFADKQIVNEWFDITPEELKAAFVEVTKAS
jgi:hypothetical protein